MGLRIAAQYWEIHITAFRRCTGEYRCMAEKLPYRLTQTVKLHFLTSGFYPIENLSVEAKITQNDAEKIVAGLYPGEADIYVNNW